jgi:hypothetical protein
MDFELFQVIEGVRFVWRQANRFRKRKDMHFVGRRLRSVSIRFC